MSRYEHGFTLIETLIVFSIFLIISSVTVILLDPQKVAIEEKAFLYQLSTDLLYAQNYALSHQCDVSFVISPAQHKYSMFKGTELPAIIERKYPSSYSIAEGSMPLNFKFLSDGNINKFGNIFIYTTNKRFTFTFLIGKGRFYVTEQ